MSQIRTNSLVPIGGIPAGASGGGIIQVVQTVKTDTFTASTASGGETSDITGLTASITPRSTSNKILISISLNCFVPDNNCQVTIFRNSTRLTAATGDAASNRARCSFSVFGMNGELAVGGYKFLDSPASTSAQTYSVRMLNPSSITRTMGVNISVSDPDLARHGRFSSTIILMEVSG